VGGTTAWWAGGTRNKPCKNTGIPKGGGEGRDAGCKKSIPNIARIGNTFQGGNAERHVQSMKRCKRAHATREGVMKRGEKRGKSYDQKNASIVSEPAVVQQKKKTVKRKKGGRGVTKRRRYRLGKRQRKTIRFCEGGVTGGIATRNSSRERSRG